MSNQLFSQYMIVPDLPIKNEYNIQKYNKCFMSFCNINYNTDSQFQTA